MFLEFCKKYITRLNRMLRFLKPGHFLLSSFNEGNQNLIFVFLYFFALTTFVSSFFAIYTGIQIGRNIYYFLVFLCSIDLLLTIFWLRKFKNFSHFRLVGIRYHVNINGIFYKKLRFILPIFMEFYDLLIPHIKTVRLKLFEESLWFVFFYIIFGIFCYFLMPKNVKNQVELKNDTKNQNKNDELLFIPFGLKPVKISNIQLILPIIIFILLLFFRINIDYSRFYYFILIYTPEKHAKELIHKQEWKVYENYFKNCPEKYSIEINEIHHKNQGGLEKHILFWCKNEMVFSQFFSDSDYFVQNNRVIRADSAFFIKPYDGLAGKGKNYYLVQILDSIQFEKDKQLKYNLLKDNWYFTTPKLEEKK